MSNLRLPARALADYSLPSLKSLARLGTASVAEWKMGLLNVEAATATKQLALLRVHKLGICWEVCVIKEGTYFILCDKYTVLDVGDIANQHHLTAGFSFTSMKPCV